jgi:glycosyltransferase involved in cell wall biosynthesis
VNRPIDVIHNFFSPRPPRRTCEEVRAELGIDREPLLLHSSNLRPLKRIDLLLESIARVRPRESLKLLILAGDSFAPFERDVRRLGLEDCVIVREKVNEIEDYLQVADLGVFTSESESFCLSILEAMCFGCPSVAMNVGGIPEVIQHDRTGLLVPFGDTSAFTSRVEELLLAPGRRQALGRDAQRAAALQFSAETIVSQYESVYARVCR